MKVIKRYKPPVIIEISTEGCNVQHDNMMTIANSAMRERERFFVVVVVFAPKQLPGMNSPPTSAQVPIP